MRKIELGDFQLLINSAGVSPGKYALIACILNLHNKEFLDVHYGNSLMYFTIFILFLVTYITSAWCFFR